MIEPITTDIKYPITSLLMLDNIAYVRILVLNNLIIKIKTEIGEGIIFAFQIFMISVFIL